MLNSQVTFAAVKDPKNFCIKFILIHLFLSEISRDIVLTREKILNFKLHNKRGNNNQKFKHKTYLYFGGNYLKINISMFIIAIAAVAPQNLSTVHGPCELRFQIMF